MFSIEPAMQIKNCLDRKDGKEIKTLRVTNDQEVIDKTLKYNSNTDYVVFNVTDLAQNRNSTGELVKISSDTTSNVNAIKYLQQQYPKLLPNIPFVIYANSAEENRMLRTFGLMDIPVTGAFSDKSPEDVSKTLDKINTITSENIKLWNLSANLQQAETDVDRQLPSVTIKSVAGNR